ncbi:hypothetical protein LTR36_007698 [Oleoguttula mirabilis]|uniref:Uncharacterized protein n=1 Tax=Oleoguttula mirabilis TaxID=1507867 RepID=A0AAV9JVB7_9PEZI|nr:hypothetical protein LTR36_007698 [Oleoguttula mirabilis]
MLVARPLRQLRVPSSSDVATAGYTYIRAYTSHIGTPQPQDTVLSEDGVRTLRKRENGGRSLPLPPLMDPVAVKAKGRYREPKPLKSEEGKTEFQKELEANPYAQALATPVRHCAVTNARLPAHFLLPLVSHLDPHQIDDTADTTKRPSKHITARLVPDIKLDIPRELRSPARGYVLAEHHILEHLSSKRRWMFVVTERMKRWFALKTGRQWHNMKVQKEWQWEEGTPEKVLGKLREEVVKRLAVAIEDKEVVLAQPGSTPLAADEEQGVACYLPLAKSLETDIEAALTQDLGIAPGVRAYDLAHLLGEDYLRRMLESHGVEDHGSRSWVAVPKSADTVELQLALLRLEAYTHNNKA